jgi:NAD-dependent deacetylase
MGEAITQSTESDQEPPICACGGALRPAVVWFGESLPENALLQASAAASTCDLIISVGTSGTVYPAAGLIEIAVRSGACLIEVNPEPTPFSRLADLRLAAPAGEALPAFVDAVERIRCPTP